MPIKLKDLNPAVFNHNVGIGVDNPSVKLEVNGEIKGTILTQTSDYRLKENITPIKDGLDKALRLNVCSFNWKDGSVETVGFLAHEVQKIISGCVDGEKDEIDRETGNPVYQSMNTTPIIAVLVSAIQNLNSKVEDLERKLDSALLRNKD